MVLTDNLQHEILFGISILKLSSWLSPILSPPHLLLHFFLSSLLHKHTLPLVITFISLILINCYTSAFKGCSHENILCLFCVVSRLVNMQLNNGATPLYIACQNGLLDIAQYLHSRNGATKIKAYDGMSCLHAAAQLGYLDLVKWLVQH